MKKEDLGFLALVVAMVLAITAVAGCSKSTADESQTSGDAGDSKKIQIGFLYGGFEDNQGKNTKRVVEKAGEALDVDIQFFADGNDSEKQLSTVENMISKGVDGILISPAADNVLPKIGKLCEENSVYLMTCYREVLDPEVKEVMEANPYFLGSVFEDEYNTSQKVVDVMIERGHNKFGSFAVPPGMAAVDQRIAAFEDTIEADKADSEKIATYMIEMSANPANLVVEGIDMFVTSYPEINAVWTAGTAGGMGEAIVATIEKHNKQGELFVGAFDSFDGMTEAFENGIFDVIACAHHADPFFAFMVLYNAVNGTPLADGPVELKMPYIFVTSAETAKQLEDYVMNEEVDLYTTEEIKAMSAAENADFDIKALENVMADYTIENIVERVDSRK